MTRIQQAAPPSASPDRVIRGQLNPEEIEPGDLLLDHARLREVSRVFVPAPGAAENYVGIWFVDQPKDDTAALHVPLGVQVCVRCHAT
jgi:hypothetical protein